MRLWHIDLLPYLPDAQFKGQLRELVATMHDWRDKGKTNHLLINRVMEYDKKELTSYFNRYCEVLRKSYKKGVKGGIIIEFLEFAGYRFGTDYLIDDFTSSAFFTDEYEDKPIFVGWHNKEYLRVCMANLYEKHFFGVGKSRITDEEWQRLLDGYKAITGEDYET